MATNITVRDLENYPDNSKTVTIDLTSIIPVGEEGDEKWAITAYTSATAEDSASIQDVFIRTTKLGYCKSTGYNSGPYTINATQDQFGVSINGSDVRQIILDDSVTALSGSSVAEDMQEKIRALADTGALEEGNLAFSNAVVSFQDGQFVIKSGVMSGSYTGTSKSSVTVSTGTSNDVSVHLGFLASIDSETIASRAISESYLTSDYTTGTSLNVGNGSLFSAADFIVITDGENTEKTEVFSVTNNEVVISGSLSNSYDTWSRVQVLDIQEPNPVPAPVLDSVDDVVRYAIYTIIDQIDFS